MDALVIKHACPYGNTDPTNFKRVTWQGVPFDIAVVCGACHALIFGKPEKEEQDA